MTHPCNDQTDLYRQRYRQGQMFRSRDLSDQVEEEEQVRWWHNRAIHHAYGIAYGCEAKKKPGATDTIAVKAGLAYDSFGRPLWFNSSVVVRVPIDLHNQEGTYVLFIHQLQQNGEGLVQRARCGETVESHASNAEFRWKSSGEFSIRDGVAVATVDLRFGGVIEKLTHACVYRTRSDRHPYLVNGQTILGHTAWEAWKESLPDHIVVWGVQVKIDTRAAGFTGQPIYVAQTAPFVGPFVSYVTNVSEVGFAFRIVVGRQHHVRGDHQARRKVLLESPQGLQWLSRLRRLVVVKWIGLELMTEVRERTR